MPLEPHLVVLVLGAAVAHATWNALVKTSGDRFLTMTLVLGTGAAIGLLVAPFVPFPARAAWPNLLGSFLFHNAYFVLLLLAYRVGDLSKVYPLARGSAPLVVAGLAAAVAGEVPTGAAMAGIALVSVGIAALAFDRGGLAAADRRAVPLALATGLTIALYTVVDGMGMRRAGTDLGYIAWVHVLDAVPFLPWALLRRGAELRAFVRTRWKGGIGGGVLATGGYGLVLFALGQGAMAEVVALRETSVLIAALIGTLMLGEPFGRTRIAAAAVIAAGLIVMRVGG